MPSLVQRLAAARRQVMRSGPGPASSWARKRSWRRPKTYYAWPKRPRNTSTVDSTTQEVRYLMPKPAVIFGRPETYVGPSRVPKPQQGETACLVRSYFKMKGLGINYRDGSDVLYRSGARSVWRTQHGLYAVFPSEASVPVLDSRMRRAYFSPYRL